MRGAAEPRRRGPGRRARHRNLRPQDGPGPCGCCVRPALVADPRDDPIAGGTGALGGHVAPGRGGRGARHIVLASRNGSAARDAEQLRDDLVVRGARLTLAACDVADRDSVRRVLAEIPADAPLSAVFHAAGVRQAHRPAHRAQPRPEAAEVAQAKVAGAAHLDELLADTPLDAFVLFSSGAAAWGSAGQAAYAAANAYLDALALQRRARGQAATAIGWGAWDSGMVDGALSAGMRRIGAPPMKPSLALRALGKILDHDETNVVVADIDWGRFLPIYTMSRPRPLLDALAVDSLSADSLAEADDPAASRDRPLRRPAEGATGLAVRLATMPATQRMQAIVDIVRAEASALLGYETQEALDMSRPFTDLGFDSVAAADLMARLSSATGRKLSPTLVFDSVRPAALAERVLEQVAPGSNVPGILDQLEANVAALSPEEAERYQVAGRLQALLSMVSSAGATQAIADLPAGITTAQEVFDFIDRELGSEQSA